MPTLDSCDCEAQIVRQGLVPGASWPECMEVHEFEAKVYKDGRCDHAPDCPGEGEVAGPCRFSVQWRFQSSCLGVGLSTFERAAESSDPWVDLGVDVVLNDGLGSLVVKPACKKERKVELTYSGQAVWDAVLRCNGCEAENGSGA